MTQSILISDEAQAAIAGCHHEAAAGIDALATSLPTSVDGGLGSLDLVAVVAAVARACGQLADVQAITSDNVGAVGEGLLATDALVRGAFVATTAGVAP